MNSFVTYLAESNFREVTETNINQSNQIADEYLKLVAQITPADEEQYKRQKLHPTWQQYLKDNSADAFHLIELKSIKFKDLQTNKTINYRVYVAFGENNKNYAMCDPDDRIIIIYNDTCKLLPRKKLVSTILHEITHGFQQHKTYSNKYQKLLDTKTPEAKKAANIQYFKEPNEFDAFTTELSYTIKTEFKRLKNDVVNSRMLETKKVMEQRVKKFLLELKLFINSPLKNYFIYKELPLPSSLSTFEDMLKTIQHDPKLWKSFKSKMINLYTLLTSE